jgi:hypothetical protein
VVPEWEPVRVNSGIELEWIGRPRWRREQLIPFALTALPRR